MRLAISGLLVVGALCGACSDDEKDVSIETVETEIEPKSGDTTLSGTIEVQLKGDKVTLTVKVVGAPPGEHGLHIHQTGDCSAGDAASAGGHWNPASDMHDHGNPTGESHLGDLGNLTVAADGTGTLTISKDEWTFGDEADTDLVGKAVVVHAKVDDFTTQPTGDSGARIGCGLLEDF